METIVLDSSKRTKSEHERGNYCQKTQNTSKKPVENDEKGTKQIIESIACSCISEENEVQEKLLILSNRGY